MPWGRVVLVAAVVLVGLVGRARADKIDELARALSDPSYKVRTQAAIVLGKLADPRAVGPLLGALRDDSEAVRAVAASSLGKLGDGRARGPLSSLLSDRSIFVQQSAQRAIAQLDAAAPPSNGSATPPPSPSLVNGGAGARFFLHVDVAPKGRAAAEQSLRSSLAAQVGRLPKVALGDRAPSAAPRATGFAVDSTITNLRVSGGQLDCDVSVAISSWPAHAIRATSSAGASVPGARPGDAQAERDCLDGAAQQIAEDLGHFLSTQR